MSRPPRPLTDPNPTGAGEGSLLDPVRSRAFACVPPANDEKSGAETTRRSCVATTRRGLACKFPARRGSSYCVNHEPGADTSANAVRAGIASGRARRAPAESLLQSAAISLRDRESLQALLERLVALELTGRIDHTRSLQILRACSVIAQTINRREAVSALDGTLSRALKGR